MKILIVPDKFKGSLSAREVAASIKAGLLSNNTLLDILIQPMADGGEGSVELLRNDPKAHIHYCQVSDPLFRPVESYFIINGSTAYIEMSLASGLALLQASEYDCMKTSTYGTGQLIQHAIKTGAREVILFVGGSATIDLGIGMASALGYRFRNTKGHEVLPIGQSMRLIRSITKSPATELLSNVKFTVITDVNNPLYGHHGAAYVYGSQKGASSREILQLDNGLRSLANVIHENLRLDMSHIPGSGAAGGLGGGAIAFLNADIQSGIQFFINQFQLRQKIKAADVVITGEGRLDMQSLYGKVVGGITAVCREEGTPCIVICGKNEINPDDMQGIEIHEIMSLAKDQTEAILNAGSYLHQLAKKIPI